MIPIATTLASIVLELKAPTLPTAKALEGKAFQATSLLAKALKTIVIIIKNIQSYNNTPLTALTIKVLTALTSSRVAAKQHF